jgi:hypothetical protein
MGCRVRLAGVREGDIVRIDDGLSYLALVRGRRGRRLLVAPLNGRWNPAPIKAAAVTAHWRRAGPRQPRDHV